MVRWLGTAKWTAVRRREHRFSVELSERLEGSARYLNEARVCRLDGSSHGTRRAYFDLLRRLDSVRSILRSRERVHHAADIVSGGDRRDGTT